MRSTPPILLALCVCMPCCAGCMYTPFLWEGATSADWEANGIEGAVVSESGRPTALVVEYTRPQGFAFESRYVLVAVDDDWRTLGPAGAVVPDHVTLPRRERWG